METDVIVIGGGPSGLTLASELARAGVGVTVIERRTDVVESRAGTLLPRVLELFDARGVADRLIRKAMSLQKWPFTTGHIWSGLKPVEWRHLGTRYDFTLIVPQNETETVLMEYAREMGANVLMGAEVTNLQVEDDGVSVTYSDASGEKHLSGKYLVGADGARSIVRKSLDFAFEGTDPTLMGLLIDLDIDFPFPGAMRSVDNERGWGLALHFGQGFTRFGIVHVESMKAGRNDPISVEECKRCIREIFGTDFGVESVKWSSRFSNQMRIVPSFQKGRAFLVGESARLHYPASGVGMNFCIQDAFNLGWKLAAVVKGHANETLLETYNDERRLIALDLMESVRAQVAVQFDFSADGIAYRRRFERDHLPLPDINRQIGLEHNGLSVRYPTDDNSHPMVGWRMPDMDLILGDGSLTRIGELLREQKFLLIDLSGENSFSDLDFGASPVKVLNAQGVNRTEQLQPLRGLLVRPDGYVAWATNSTPDAIEVGAALGRWLSPSRSREELEVHNA